MADFFDEFGKKVADVASDLSKKAGDTGYGHDRSVRGYREER